jgi:hypothetical protein
VLHPVCIVWDVSEVELELYTSGSVLRGVSVLYICSIMHACCCAYVMRKCVCRSNTTLLNLVLSHNVFKDEGVESLATALRCDVKAT